MNKILSGLGIALLLLGTSCQDDDTPQAVPARPHSEVYPEDLVKIEEYLKSHYVAVNDYDGSGDIDIKEVPVIVDGAEVFKKEIEIDSLDENHTVSIWDQQEYPLQSKIVKLYGVEFKVYYLKFDTNTVGDQPCGVDRIGVSYEGSLLDGYQFDYAPNLTEFNLIDVVKGWEHIMPLFRAGIFDPTGGDGSLNPVNFGSGVMFLPSGLGYYNAGFGNIPSYAPLVFKFNLFSVTRLDQDVDGIESQYEYELDANGNLIDFDADGIPDVFDADDDNDGYITKDEITHTVTYKKQNGVVQSVSRYLYPFNGAAIDDPATEHVDEAQGIPDCSLDYITPTRVRRHLDKNCFATINLDVIVP